LAFANELDCHVFAASHALACRPQSALPLEGFAYAGGERLSMAYMDMPREGDSNGRTEGSKKQRTEETP
jgi:hypothetical protein